MPVTLSSNVNNATCLITVHTARKKSPEFDRQIHQTRLNDQLTRQSKKAAPTRDGKRETDEAHGRLWWRHFHQKNLPLKNFSGGGQICNEELPSKNSKNVDFDCIMKAFFDERNNRVCQHCGVRTSTVTPSFYCVFNISLSCENSMPSSASFIGNLWRALLLGNYLKSKYVHWPLNFI